MGEFGSHVINATIGQHNELILSNTSSSNMKVFATHVTNVNINQHQEPHYDNMCSLSMKVYAVNATIPVENVSIYQPQNWTGNSMPNQSIPQSKYSFGQLRHYSV